VSSASRDWHKNTKNFLEKAKKGIHSSTTKNVEKDRVGTRHRDTTTGTAPVTQTSSPNTHSVSARPRAIRKLSRRIVTAGTCSEETLSKTFTTSRTAATTVLPIWSQTASSSARRGDETNTIISTKKEKKRTTRGISNGGVKKSTNSIIFGPSSPHRETRHKNIWKQFKEKQVEGIILTRTRKRKKQGMLITRKKILILVRKQQKMKALLFRLKCTEHI